MARPPKADTPEEREQQIRLWIEHKLHPDRFDGKTLYEVVRDRFDLNHTSFGKRIPRWLRGASDEELADYLENGIPSEPPAPDRFSDHEIKMMMDNAVLMTRIGELEATVKAVLTANLVSPQGRAILEEVLGVKARRQ